MAITEPESMDDLLYFTRRALDNDGKIMAWVYKPVCSKCGKEKMGKPLDPKKGTVKIRALEYICPGCGFTISKDELEPTLTVEIIYTCPHCKKSGETTTLYKRKKFMGADSYIFECNDCHQKIGITKKMKKLKEK